jgi:hypothetical protein
MDTNVSTERDPAGQMVMPVANHIVLNVRDIEESHRFWTEIIGFTHVGDIDGTLSYSVQLPTEGALALTDRTQGLPTFGEALPRGRPVYLRCHCITRNDMVNGRTSHPRSKPPWPDGYR